MNSVPEVGFGVSSVHMCILRARKGWWLTLKRMGSVLRHRWATGLGSICWLAAHSYHQVQSFGAVGSLLISTDPSASISPSKDNRNLNILTSQNLTPQLSNFSQAAIAWWSTSVAAHRRGVIAPPRSRAEASHLGSVRPSQPASQGSRLDVWESFWGARYEQLGRTWPRWRQSILIDINRV